ncbi:Diamine acetyltransferase 2 [Leucoagaricus sp. SymC.cos]|nr:Diamine acetyltransferase 2 [Leucoagaricus sp. SymC.cos]
MSASEEKKQLEVVIREATPDDIGDILQLIIDLADYEKARNSAKATPELLHKNLFGEKPYAHALLAFLPPSHPESPRGAVGLALYFFNFSTWTGKPGLYLEDLFVKPEYRSFGVGKALFRKLGEVAQAKDCARLDWAVLKWNQPSIDFYEKKLGATMMSEWVGMRLEEDGISNLKYLG